MLLHETVELLFSAIAAPFNPAFERDSPKSGRAPQFYYKGFPINATLNLVFLFIVS